MFAASMSQGQTMIYNIYPYNNEKRVERERERERERELQTETDVGVNEI